MRLAVEALRSGDLVVVPTDSVYAIVADAFSRAATGRLLSLKERGRAPLPVVVRSPRQVSGLVEHIPEPAERLMAAYWPGPLTLVFPAADGLAWDLGDARGTVSLRMPAADFLLDLVAEIGPLACTGASRRGDVAPEVADVRRHLVADVALYVDGGHCSGPPSTVVDVTRARCTVLRPGAIDAQDVDLVAGGMVGWGRRPGDAEATERTATDHAAIDQEGLVPSMRIAIGSDHAGYPLKQHLITTLEGLGHEVTDHGTDSEDSVDYPPFCAAVGRAVVRGDADRGIVLGGSGQGEQIAANKVRGVRAALCHDLYTARMSRQHNDANVLAIGGRIVATGLADEIVELWLSTDFDGGRHQRRIDQITDIEREHEDGSV